MQTAASMDDYRWLVSDAACRWLDEAAASAVPLVTLTRSLRRELTAARTHLVLEQLALRRRAAEKFSLAPRMFFTRELLEQATDERIAAYKAGRFAVARVSPEPAPSAHPVADLCCGVGGDLLALAERGPALGVDRSATAVLLAAANCRVAGVEQAVVREQDATAAAVSGVSAWHLDPDRRAAGRRTTQLEHYEPGLPVIARLLDENPQGAVKLAPATAAPSAWAEQAELEWIGSRGECRQQVAWFAALARYPGQHSATIVDVPGPARTVFTCHGRPECQPPVAAAVGRFVFEPHAAIRAAQLVGEVAAQYQLAAVAPGAGYLTGDRPAATPALDGFAVSDVLPFDLKRVRGLIRQRQIGNLEVKKRRVAVDPEQLRRQLACRGDKAAVLILTPHRSGTVAILAQRLSGL